MAQALIAVSNAGTTLSYFFENWNSDVVSIGCLLAGILMLSGYFWGRFFQKICPSLQKADATFLGVFAIFAGFELYSFWAVQTRADVSHAGMVVAVLLCAGPVLCIAFRANVIPSWKHLASLVVGIFIAWVLGAASAKLNTNNIFFDSVFYLSETLESSVNSTFGGMDFYVGREAAVDFLHDVQGCYYLWGTLLRWVRQSFEVNSGSLTPVYIWGASVLYFMSLGNLLVSSVNTVFTKQKWFALPVCLLLLSPFYTNYFNTTLGFFGNTMRTVCVGWAMLIIYDLVRSHEKMLYLPLGIVAYAGIAFSSSSLFIFVFMIAGLFFALSFMNKTVWTDYAGLMLASIGVLQMALVLVLPSHNTSFWFNLIVPMALMGAAAFVFWLLRDHLAIVNKIIRILFPVVLIGLIVLSYPLCDSEYGYSFFFEKRSYHDMCNNYTAHDNTLELWRNIVMYAMIGLLFVNFKTKKSFKVFLLVTAALFLNPLTEPFVANHLTLEAYNRSFDLLVNPFTLCFYIANMHRLLKPFYVSWGALPVLGVAATVMIAQPNLTVPYSITLTFDSENMDWEYKVTDDQMDIYKYINDTLKPSIDHKPVILSQDVDLKAYVDTIYVPFSANRFRLGYETEEGFNSVYDEMTLLNPHRLTDANKVVDPDGNEVEGDYANLSKLVDYYQADYLLIRNTVALWDERGWFDKCYISLIHSGQAEVEYENDSWALLKINHDYKEDAESSEENTETENSGTEETETPAQG